MLLKAVEANVTVETQDAKDIVRRHDAPGWLKRALAAAKAAFDRMSPSVNQIRRTARKALTRVEKHNARDTRRIMPAAVARAANRVPLPEDVIREHLSEQVRLIRGLGDEYRDRVREVLEKGISAGTRSEIIAKRLTERVGVARSRARFIARDQVLSANAAVREAKHKAVGIEEYTWSAVRGPRTREHHRALDGTVHRYDDPPVGGGTGPRDRGNPGDGIYCRCVAIPIIPEEIWP